MLSREDGDFVFGHHVEPLADHAVALEQGDGRPVKVGVERVRRVDGQTAEAGGHIARRQRLVRAGSALVVHRLRLVVHVQVDGHAVWPNPGCRIHAFSAELALEIGVEQVQSARRFGDDGPAAALLRHDVRLPAVRGAKLGVPLLVVGVALQQRVQNVRVARGVHTVEVWFGNSTCECVRGVV